MNQVKQLIQFIGQAGGTVALPLAELQELGVEISLENICDPRNGRVVLRLGPKIYYVPQAQAPELEQDQEVTEWPDQETIPLTPPIPRRRSSSASLPPEPPEPSQENPVDLEMEAINRLTNRPTQRRTPAQLQKELEKRVQKSQRTRPSTNPPPNGSDVRVSNGDGNERQRPWPKVGVHRLNDAELWLQEQVHAEQLRTRSHAKRAEELRTGDLPFRTIPGK